MTDAIRFLEPGCERDVAALGGKGAGLAFLMEAGVNIPPAFVVTADGYREAVGPDLRAAVSEALEAIPAGLRGAELDDHTRRIRDLIVEGTDRHALTPQVRAACEELQARTGMDELTVAVRSSSIAEDSADKSFAGEHDTFLWVDGPNEVDRRLRECWASLVTSRAVAYREGTAHAELAMAVVVQQMVPARAAGVFMTLNPVNGDRSKLMIESVWGLGEPLVSGEVTPDRFLVDKITGEIVKREHASKDTAAVRDPATGRGIALSEVAGDRRELPSLTKEEIAELVRVGRLLERAAGAPQDGEFAVVDGEAPDNVLLLQCRPETVWSRKPRSERGEGRQRDGGDARDADRQERPARGRLSETAAEEPAWRDARFPSLYDVEPPEGAEGLGGALQLVPPARAGAPRRGRAALLVPGPPAPPGGDAPLRRDPVRVLVAGARSVQHPDLRDAAGLRHRSAGGQRVPVHLADPGAAGGPRGPCVGVRRARRALLRALGRDLRGVEGQDGRPPRADEGDALRARCPTSSRRRPFSRTRAARRATS